MIQIALPGWVHRHRFPYDPTDPDPLLIESLRKKLQIYAHPAPRVSIVIPAYNEAANILHTLSSLSEIALPFPAELIVVNNRSTDTTAKLLEAVQVRTLYEDQQGIRYARARGLAEARGNILLQADADSLYPPGWGTAYVRALEAPQVMVAYGSHAFVPDNGTQRAYLVFHEHLAYALYALRRKNHEHYNTLGFNMAFRTADGREKGSYAHDAEGSEDGQMTYMLKPYGRCAYFHRADCRVWTSTRRLMEAGNLARAFWYRLKRDGRNLRKFLSREEHKKN